ncbi:MAG TPA: M15 family metallopeptidase [Terriglobales bacterium]|jgi:hypothetical protein
MLEQNKTTQSIFAADVAVQSLQPPHGIEQIISSFGNIYEYVRKDGSLDPRWAAEFLVRIALPFPLVLSWDHATSVKQMTCHKKLADVFADVFGKLEAGGLQAKIKTFGGGFSFRQQRTGSKLSAHAWGIAVDLNPETNGQGTVGDMDADVIEIFRAAGFEWGGDWAGKVRDPMHFQFCSGY